MTIQQHNVIMSKTRYPGGLRIFECWDCDYAFAAELQRNGILDPGSRVPINIGDPGASHALFMTPVIDLRLDLGAEVATDDDWPRSGC